MDFNQLTPMMKQYFEIKGRYQEYILLYRLGDFYEMFFDDAITASRELELTLTGRNAGLEEKAPLCGVPYHSIDNYISKLIEKGYKVAICEQVEDPTLAKGLVRRDVVKIITPGTVTNPEMLHDHINSYIASLYIFNNSAAIIYSDISTFEIYGFEINGEFLIEKIHDEIKKINPREILICSEYMDEILLKNLTDENFVFTSLDRHYFSIEKGKEKIKETFKRTSVNSLGIDDYSLLSAPLGALIEYIKETQKITLEHFGELTILHGEEYLTLDQSSISNLELFQTLRNHDKKGSLIWVLNQTKTAMGYRMLKNWLSKPLRNLDKIHYRQRVIRLFIENDILRDDLENNLKKVYDLERLTSKLIYGNITPRDLISIKSSLAMIPDIKTTLNMFKNEDIDQLNQKIDTCTDIFSLIHLSIIEDPPVLLKEGGYIKRSYRDDLNELDNILKNGKNIILEIEAKEKERTGIKNLKIKYNRVFGYYIEITKSNINLVPEDYIRKQTLANAERYITEDLKAVEDKILNAHDRMIKIESEIYTQVIEKIKNESEKLLFTSKGISELDVLISLSKVAIQNQYVCPIYNLDGIIHIEKGRHPVIEKIVKKENFIDNNTFMDHEDNQFYVITGPNMAGKSTYLRQIALISLMGQIGSFVPAESAELTILDRIFTRVGASDDLSQGQSTFMVEMSELSNILKYATNDSLVLLDEIGRGTSTFDGLSIAWAVVEYLTDRKFSNPKTLFATHYHELTELEGQIRGVKNYNITVQEYKDDIIFLRKIIQGSANQSYGIQVAQLAGIPNVVISNAKKILKELENNDIARIPKISDDDYQVSFFRESEESIIIELDKIDIDRISPIEALMKLDELIKLSKRVVEK
ncbi:MAG: DNA mismatch repair protein MutS [Clostridiales bacterium]|nr:DNA mismatch repair protein MutS [Clostridiales bacterium]